MVKNIEQAVGVFGLTASDIAAQAGGTVSVDAEAALPARIEQKISYCFSSDGTQIAYAETGEGPPLVKAPNWMTHLEFELESPVWRHVISELSAARTLVRFDQRANGLSDWEAEEVSLDAFVTDLETVVDALGLERFPLLGVSQGCAISIAYAVKYPEKVSRLILYGGFARGPFKRGAAEKENAEAMLTLIKHGWGQDNPAFRQMFTSRFIPGGTPEQMEWFNELQRVSVSAENAVRLRRAIGEFDVSALLSQVTQPTLIIHCNGDEVAPFNESKRMAAGIPGAELLALDGDNHLILEDEPAWPKFVAAVRGFLADGAD